LFVHCHEYNVKGGYPWGHGILAIKGWGNLSYVQNVLEIFEEDERLERLFKM
jgi:hypothetical protein